MPRKFVSLLILSALVTLLGSAAVMGAVATFSLAWWLSLAVAAQSGGAIWVALGRLA